MIPGLRRLWRDEYALQLGVDPAYAVVVELPDPSIARVLDLLDGSRTEQIVLREAAALGITPATAGPLLAVLRDAGLLLPVDTLLPHVLTEPVRRRLLAESAALALRARDRPGTGSAAEALRRRAAAAVLVTGPSRLAVPLCAALASAGIGHVDPAVHGRVNAVDSAIGGLLPDDAQRPRGTAATEAIRRVAPESDTRTLRGGAATFVVQIGPGVPAELAALAYARRSMAHLLVEERDGVVLVGPLVTPGGSPCLNCLDLHRRDRDPAWPALVAQLATAGDEPVATSVSTTMIAVGVATAQVLGYVDGDDVDTIGASIEIGPPIRLRRRSWSAHPRCDCPRRPKRPARPRTRAYQVNGSDSSNQDEVE